MQQVQIPDPPTPPAPPTIPPAPAMPGQSTGGAPAPSTASASQVYRAMVEQRNEVERQLRSLEDRRRSIGARLREGEVSGADKAGLEARVTDLDAQITEMYKKLGVANDQVARAAAQPGAVQPDPFTQRGGPPEEVIAGGFVLALAMILPISIAIARRIWRRGSPAAAPAMSREMEDRMARLEQAMDAVAVEVERVGEGQRYMTRVLGSGAAEPMAVRAREAVEAKR